MDGADPLYPSLLDLLEAQWLRGDLYDTSIATRSNSLQIKNELQSLHDGVVKILFGEVRGLSFETLYRTAYMLCQSGNGELLRAYVNGWLAYAAVHITSRDAWIGAVGAINDVFLFWRKNWAAVNTPAGTRGRTYITCMARSMKLVLVLEKHCNSLKDAFSHWYFRAAPLSMRPGGKARKRDYEAYAKDLELSGPVKEEESDTEQPVKKARRQK